MSEQCPKCASEISPGARFCSLCGFELSLAAKQPDRAGTNPTTSANPSSASSETSPLAEVDAQSSNSDAESPALAREDGIFVAEAVAQDPGTDDSPYDDADPIRLLPNDFSVANRKGSPFRGGNGVTLAKTPKFKELEYASLVLLPEYENFRAVGGAVGALVLGVFSLIGIWFTPWAMVNAVIGIFMSLWGLGSKKKRMASIGAGLCLCTFVLFTFFLFV